MKLTSSMTNTFGDSGAVLENVQNILIVSQILHKISKFHQNKNTKMNHNKYKNSNYYENHE